MSQLLSNLSIGAKVKFGKFQVNTEEAQPIVWTVVAKNHQCTPAYPANAITLHAAEILDLRCFDAKEPNSHYSSMQDMGNGRYSVCNLDQWLNKDAAGSEWYIAAHVTDQSPDSSSVVDDNTPYAARPGFLNGFTDNEKAAILPTTIRVAKSKTYGGSYEDIVRKIFLPSITEVGLSNENNIAEGASWGYYTSDDARKGKVTQQCFDNTLSSSKPSSKTGNWQWWLRTPEYSADYNANYIYVFGTAYQHGAFEGETGVRPALNLSSSLLVSDSTDADGCYTFVWETTTTYDLTNLNLSAGNYAITVVAEAQGFTDSDASNSVNYSVQAQLAAPTIAMNADGKTLEITDVENATSYDVYVDGTLKTNVAVPSGYTVTFTRKRSGMNGYWGYSLDGGANWNAISQSATPLVVENVTSIKFRTKSVEAGFPYETYMLWDNPTGRIDCDTGVWVTSDEVVPTGNMSVIYYGDNNPV